MEVEPNKNGKTIIKTLAIEIDNEKIFFNLQNNQIKEISINGNEITIQDKEKDKDLFKINNENRFIPSILCKYRDVTFIKDEMKVISKWSEQPLYDNLLMAASDKLKEYFWHSTNDDTIKDGISKIGLPKKEYLEEILLQVFRTNKSFIKNMNDDEKKYEILEILYSYLLAMNVNMILNSINDGLTNTFNGIRYIAPLRSTAQRYYRFQDLQVKEIDHEGSNLAMLLNSLTDTEKKDFAKWTKNNLGFSLRVKEEGLHYSLKIKIGDEEDEYNISDMGFGFSQISPIIATLWLETVKKKSTVNNLIFAIEQPELHLHPKFQAKLTRLFVNIISFANKNSNSIKIIFETHSNVMIDTLGECIEEQLIEKDDISIVLFEKETSKSNTIIKKSGFDDDGFLINWPIGFFSGSEYGY